MNSKIIYFLSFIQIIAFNSCYVSMDDLLKTKKIGIISTIAGTTIGFSGDGGAAASAQLNSPNGVYVDSSDNIYIADATNHRIRKVDTSGLIFTVAGNGTPSNGGDGGDATLAQLYEPWGVFVDSSGNIYIADTSNHRIRKVDTSGTISTVAGTTSGFIGDNGAATSARLNYPSGVCVDSSGNIYIADTSNNRIRKVNTSGIISTFAGDGSASYGGDGLTATSAQLYYPTGVCVDSSGNIYIADYLNHRIRKVNTSGTISTVAGTTLGFSGDGGAATSAQLNFPRGVFADSSGNIYIADRNNHRIRKVDTSGIISTVAGTTIGFSGDGGAAASAQLNSPNGVYVDSSDNIYIADATNHLIRKVTYKDEVVLE